MAQETTTSKLAQALCSGRPALIAEWVPAAVSDADSLKRLTAALPTWLDAVVVASNGVSALACSTLLAADGLETVLTLSTGDRNRDALLSDARGATLGIPSALCLSGGQPSPALHRKPPPRSTSTQLNWCSVKSGDGPGRRYSSASMSTRNPPAGACPDRHAEEGCRRRRLPGHAPHLRCHSFEEWMTAVRNEGLNERAGILAAVQPLTNVDEAVASQQRRHIPDEVVARLQSATDAAAEGIALCAELAARLVHVEGVRGIYIRSSGKPEAVAEIVRRAGLRAA
jgi:methylenetetrahydrofolate reductase (NADPH)